MPSIEDIGPPAAPKARVSVEVVKPTMTKPEMVEVAKQDDYSTPIKQD